MSTKKKYTKRYAKQWFLITTYNKIGLFRRSTFFVRSTTHEKALKKLMLGNPKAIPLSVSPIGNSNEKF